MADPNIVTKNDLHDPVNHYGVFDDSTIEDEVKRVSRGSLSVYRRLPAGSTGEEQPDVAEDNDGSIGPLTTR